MLNMSWLTSKSTVSVLQLLGRCLVHLASSSSSLFVLSLHTRMAQKAPITEFMLTELTCTMDNGLNTGSGHSFMFMIQLE